MVSTPSSTPSRSECPEAAECRSLIQKNIKSRDALVVRRQEAERESAKHQQNASKGTKRRGNAKEHRYELLTQTRDINIAIKNIDNEISANINAYSQAKMLSFSQEMLVRLPREVRDLVYENLMDRVCKRKNDITLYMDHRRQPKKMWADKPSVFPFTNDWVKKPFHYEDSDYVGIEFARELVEMYYRKTTFHLRDSSLSILGTWLRQDPFGYDLVVHRNLCHLTLQIDFRSPGMYFSPNGYRISEQKTRGAAITQARELIDKLAPLALLNRRCAIKISFGVWIEAVGMFQFATIAKALAPIVATLEENGCSVVIPVGKYRTKIGVPEQVGSWTFDCSHRTTSKALSDAAKKYDNGTDSPDLGLVNEFMDEFTPIVPTFII